MEFSRYILPFFFERETLTLEEWKDKMKDAVDSYNLYFDNGLMEEIDQHIGYAVKEGYLDPYTAKTMTYDERDDYYNKCVAFDPDDYIPHMARPLYRDELENEARSDLQGMSGV